MTWTYCDKQIAITKQTDHGCTVPGVTGGPLAAHIVDFTPDEFHLAAAVCSHMHPVTPSAAGPEALMVRSLVAHHVDDVRPGFAIEASADGFKDFVKSYFSGTVATGLAYLAMIRSGYDWAGHFEHLKPAGTGGRAPDFVFAAQDKGTCLVESKGTRSAARGAFDVTVEEGYLEQVERHLGQTLAHGALASHGYCIGAWMTSVSGAELLVHHSAPPSGTSTANARPDDRPADSGDDPSLSLVQQQDYATAFSIALGDRFARALRGGLVEDLPPLVKFEWWDRQWIASAYQFRFARSGLDQRRWPLHLDWDEDRLTARRRYFYAIEAGNLRAVLKHFWGGTEPGRPIEGLAPLDSDLIARPGREGEGAVLPDGLALIRRPHRFRGRFVRWNPHAGQFES